MAVHATLIGKAFSPGAAPEASLSPGPPQVGRTSGFTGLSKRVLIVRASDWKALVKTDGKGKKSYDAKTLQARMGLENVTADYDLVYVPVFPDSGGHFSSAFWFPAIPASIHFDTFASCGLYGLALRELAPFIRACSGQDIILVRKDESNGIPRQPAYSNVCGFTAVRFLMKALDELKKINYSELERPTSAKERQQKLFSFLAQLETSASEYHQWRLDACEDLENLKVEYGEYRKRKADQILEQEAKKHRVAGEEEAAGSEDEAIMGGKAATDQPEIEVFMEDLSQSQD